VQPPSIVKDLQVFEQRRLGFGADGELGAVGRVAKMVEIAGAAPRAWLG
jgi:hypothetical protein